MPSERIERLLARLESDRNLADTDGFDILLSEMDRVVAGICELTLSLPEGREFFDYAALVTAAALIIANCGCPANQTLMKGKLAVQVMGDVERITMVMPALTSAFHNLYAIAERALTECRQAMADIGAPVPVGVPPTVH